MVTRDFNRILVRVKSKTFMLHRVNTVFFSIFYPSGSYPQIYQPVVSACGDKRTVGSPGQADGLIEKCDEPLAQECVPYLDSAIGAGGGDSGTILRPGQTIDIAGMALIDKQALSGTRIPHLHG